jgi:hypothetical protein
MYPFDAGFQLRGLPIIPTSGVKPLVLVLQILCYAHAKYSNFDRDIERVLMCFASKNGDIGLLARLPWENASLIGNFPFKPQS